MKGRPRAPRRGLASATPPRAARVLALLVLAGAAVATACKRSGAAEQSGPAGSSAPPAERGLALSLVLADDERSVDVTLKLTGPEVPTVRALRATRGWADTHPLAGVRDVEVRDATGPIGVGAPVDDDVYTSLPLARAPSGAELTVHYTARAGAEASRFALHRGAGGVVGVGHAFLLRPAVAGSLPLTVNARIGASPPERARFLTSLPARSEGTADSLADAVFVAGAATDRALPGGDRAVIAFGARLDGPSALAVTAAVRASAVRAFALENQGIDAPLSLFVLGERGIGRDHDGASFGGALALWLDTSRDLDDAARILLAHETLHRVFGGALRIDANGTDAAWFSEGFATHYARRALLDAGSITADSFLADVARGDEERTRAAAAAGDARSVGYGLGARYAATLDAKVRARSAGKRSLDDVVRALSTLARAAPRAPIALRSFREIVATEIGADDERALWNGLVAGALPDLPDDAYGPCFRRATTTRKVFELGFDETSVDGPMPVIRGTVKGSAAERAGVKDGALLLTSSLSPGAPRDPDLEISLVLSDPRGKKRIRYLPSRDERRSTFVAQPCSR